MSIKFQIRDDVIHELKEKFRDIMEFCQMYKIPMFMSCCVEDGNDYTNYYNQMYSAKANNIHLYDDQIERHLLIANGFSAVPKREDIEIDMNMFMEEEYGEL